MKIIIKICIAYLLVRLKHRMHHLTSLTRLALLPIRVLIIIAFRDVNRQLIVSFKICVCDIWRIEFIDTHLTMAYLIAVVFLYIFK